MIFYLLAVPYFIFIYVMMRVSSYGNWLILLSVLSSYFVKFSGIKVTKQTFAGVARQILFLIFLWQFSLLAPLLQLLGSLLNLIVVSANSKMPVSKTAFGCYSRPDLSEIEKETYMFLEPDTKFAYLADIIYVPNVGILSIGDIFLYLGELILIGKYFLGL